jgi:hypothetical protein
VAVVARARAHENGPGVPLQEKEGSATRGPGPGASRLPAYPAAVGGGQRLRPHGLLASSALAAFTADEVTVQLTSRPICLILPSTEIQRENNGSNNERGGCASYTHVYILHTDSEFRSTAPIKHELHHTDTVVAVQASIL